MPKRTVAIHQPNFFPWLGYFYKLRHADVFIFLDDVQFPKTGGTWINRVMVRQNGNACWLTAPIDRNYSGVRNIKEMKFAHQRGWRDKILKTLAAAYGRTPYFSETMSVLKPLILNDDGNIAEYNIFAITSIYRALGLPPLELYRSSELESHGAATDRLISLTKAVSGDCYLCGQGAAGYQEDELFLSSGLSLQRSDFAQVPYPQHGADNFIGGLSIIDALMSLGIREAANRLCAA